MTQSKADEELSRIVQTSNRIVFFGGAGVSTESGIPDFRSAEGLYNQREKTSYAPEQIISHSFFFAHPVEFFDYYKKNLVHADALPNPAHYALARLEREGKLSAVVTQNIDGLHQKAGSSTVFELHGSIYKNRCDHCGKRFDLDYIMSFDSVPRCPSCGGPVKPEVVLYEEPLDEGVWRAAAEEIALADTLIVGGTSLSVYPAASLLQVFRGDQLVLINKDATPYDSVATLTIREPIGEALAQFA